MRNYIDEKNDYINKMILKNRKENVEDVQFSTTNKVIATAFVIYFAIGFPLICLIFIGAILIPTYDYICNSILITAIIIYAIGVLYIVLATLYGKIMSGMKYPGYNFKNDNAIRLWNKAPEVRVNCYIKVNDDNVVIYDKKTVKGADYDYIYDVNKRELDILLYNLRRGVALKVDLTEDDFKDELITLKEIIDFDNEVETEKTVLSELEVK